ncbi:MAG TPA: proton-conducting transporter membrane subunit [Steroidobacteraceae bacterium]|nr:proton-conducting transporter membrane subunit [Steroidobacteraceae bacterium]
MILLLILALPLLAAAVASAAMARQRLRPSGPARAAHRAIAAVTVMTSLAVLALAARVALSAAAGITDTALSGSLRADALSALIVLLVALVAATSAVYSFGYMARECAREPGRLSLYYANYNLFVFAMLAIPLVDEPTLVWIFVELTTLSSALLVSFESTQAALEAAWKYVTLSLMGAAIALLGFLLLFSAMQAAGGDSFTWQGLIDAAPRMPPALLGAAFVAIVVGFGTKVGLVPLHTWLPDAHSQAPTPVCALLSGIETTSVLYVILRLLPVLDGSPVAVMRDWMVGFGLLSVGVAAFLLLQVRDYKRLFAFSTVEHMGIILVAVGLAGKAAHFGAMYQILGHAVTKSFCFFAAGAAVLTVTTRNIASVRGLVRASPAAAAALLLGGLAIAGAPPLPIFMSELAILRAGLAAGRYVVVGLLALFIVVAFFGILMHLNGMVFGRYPPAADAALDPAPHEGAAVLRLPRTCTLMLVLAGALMLLLGLVLPSPLRALLQLAAAGLQR